MYNFKLKFKTVLRKQQKNFRGYFLPHRIYPYYAELMADLRFSRPISCWLYIHCVSKKSRIFSIVT